MRKRFVSSIEFKHIKFGVVIFCGLMMGACVVGGWINGHVLYNSIPIDDVRQGTWWFVLAVIHFFIMIWRFSLARDTG